MVKEGAAAPLTVVLSARAKGAVARWKMAQSCVWGDRGTGRVWRVFVLHVIRKSGPRLFRTTFPPSELARLADERSSEAEEQKKK